MDGWAGKHMCFYCMAGGGERKDGASARCMSIHMWIHMWDWCRTHTDLHVWAGWWAVKFWAHAGAPRPLTIHHPTDACALEALESTSSPKNYHASCNASLMRLRVRDGEGPRHPSMSPE